MNHPGRLNHLVLYVYDTTLPEERRNVHLKLAFPQGYDTSLALPEIERARQLRASGRGNEAALLLRKIVDNPPGQEDG